MSKYDVVLVGAGPTATAALSALPTGLRVAIVAGLPASAEPIAGLHPKIRTVAASHAEHPGVSAYLRFKGHSRGGIFTTAILGGLANYWGQQLVRYEESGPWPAEIFSNYRDYQVACSQIEGQFSFSPGAWAEDPKYLGASYWAQTPNLLVGTMSEPRCGLLAIRRRLLELVAERNAEILHVSALSWHQTPQDIVVRLSDRTSVVANQILLAGGVIGTLRLTQASCPEIEWIALNDHAPYLIHLLGLNSALELNRSDQLDHFNVMTIEQIKHSRVHLFASVYQLSKAPLNLVLASFGLPMLTGNLRLPKFADRLTPLQVWTDTSRMRYLFKRNSDEVILDARPEINQDTELEKFREWLAPKATNVYMSITKPGEGFHYFGGEVETLGRGFVCLADYLRERTCNRVACVDASILSKIGCRPPTLTAMAAAWQVTTNRV